MRGMELPVLGSVGVLMMLLLAGCSPPDVLASALSGKSCSVVNLDLGKSYCQPLDTPTRPMPICTATIGEVADCWADAKSVPPNALVLGDAPPLTAAQQKDQGEDWLQRKWGD
jgi:hypothetical protein